MKNKFKGLRTAIDGAVEDGIDGIVCMSPSALGDNYEEICENLSIIANNGLAVGFIKNENYGKVIPDPQPTPLSSLGLAELNSLKEHHLKLSELHNLARAFQWDLNKYLDGEISLKDMKAKHRKVFKRLQS